MKKARTASLLWTLALAATMASAQAASDQKPTGGKPPEAAGASGASSTLMTRQVAEMKKLGTLAGRWRTEETFDKSAMMPNGGSGTGGAEWHFGPGELSLIQNYNSTGTLGHFAGHGVVWWDGNDQSYKSFWCDNMSGCALLGAGRWEGSNLVIDGSVDMMGKKAKLRQIVSDMTPDAFTYQEEISTDGSALQPAMTIKYTRTAGPRGPGGPRGPNPKE